jgi:hypothetical protein
MGAQTANTVTFTYNAGSVATVAAIGDVSISGATIDVSTLGANAYREFIAGKYQATFSVEVLWNYTDHGSICADLLSRTAKSFAIDFGDGTVSGSAICTSASVSAAQDDAVRSTLQFQVVGALTIAA